MIQERVLINPIKVDSSVYSLVARYNIFSYLVLVVEWIGKISYLFNVLHSSGWTNTGIVEWSSMPLGNIAGHDWGRSEGSALRSELLCQSPFRHLTIYLVFIWAVAKEERISRKSFSWLTWRQIKCACPSGAQISVFSFFGGLSIFCRKYEFYYIYFIDEWILLCIRINTHLCCYYIRQCRPWNRIGLWIYVSLVRLDNLRGVLDMGMTGWGKGCAVRGASSLGCYLMGAHTKVLSPSPFKWIYER